MTHLVQTLNNYSLKPLAEFIAEGLRKTGKAFIRLQEKRGLERAIAELRKYRTYRKTYDELMQLSDRELRDLGISRSMIHSIALEVYTDNLHNK